MPLPVRNRAWKGFSLRALRDRALEASLDALADHAALKLGESTADLKHECVPDIDLNQ
jgi:hypothetical protein